MLIQKVQYYLTPSAHTLHTVFTTHILKRKTSPMVKIYRTNITGQSFGFVHSELPSGKIACCGLRSYKHCKLSFAWFVDSLHPQVLRFGFVFLTAVLGPHLHGGLLRLKMDCSDIVQLLETLLGKHHNVPMQRNEFRNVHSKSMHVWCNILRLVH